MTKPGWSRINLFFLKELYLQISTYTLLQGNKLNEKVDVPDTDQAKSTNNQTINRDNEGRGIISSEQ